MNWKSHALIGVLSALALLILLFQITNILQLLPLVIFAGFSALLPDLDHRMSKGRELFDLLAVISSAAIGYLTSSLSNFLILIGIYFLFFTLIKLKHRGFMHSLLFTLLYSIALYFLFGFFYAIAGFIGYLSHLLADRELKIF